MTDAGAIDDPSLNQRMTLLTRASLILDRLTQRGSQSRIRDTADGRGAADKPGMG